MSAKGGPSSRSRFEPTETARVAAKSCEHIRSRGSSSSARAAIARVSLFQIAECNTPRFKNLRLNQREP